MQSFDYLLTTKPHDIRAVFVSDLHLSEYTPSLNQAFIKLLKDLMVLPNLQSLYILGDWLDGWIGDDDYLTLDNDNKKIHWLTPILNNLKTLNQKTQIYVMHGNRDFMIGSSLCDEFGGILIDEPYYLTIPLSIDNHDELFDDPVLDKPTTQTIRLEHGDRLCTDDKSYQRYRAIIRNPIIRWLIGKRPLHKRRELAQNIKRQSTCNKTQKNSTIMDVNNKAVNLAFVHCQILIHGHTHRPDIHHIHDKKRMVLGDWRDDDGKVCAVIGAIDDDGIGLWEFVANV